MYKSLLALAAVLLSTSSASATVFTFEGTVTVGLQCGPIAPGVYPFSNTVDFDPALVAQDFGYGNDVYTPIVGSATLGGTTWTCDPSVESAVYGYPTDVSPECKGPDLWSIITVGLAPGVMPPTGLPQAIETSDFTYTQVDVITTAADDCQATGTITSVSVGGPPAIETVMAVSSTNANVLFGSTVIREDSAKSRLRPSVIQGELEGVLGELEDGGCLNDSEPEEGVAGRYKRKRSVGRDDTGELDDLSYAEGEFGYTAANGVEVGSQAGLLSHYNGAGQLAGERMDDGFVAGEWVRVAGKRGVFVTVTGTCDNQVDPMPILDSWIGGGLL